MIICHSKQNFHLVSKYFEEINIVPFEKEKIQFSSLSSYKKNHDVLKFAKKNKHNVIVFVPDDSDKIIVHTWIRDSWNSISLNNIDLIFLSIKKNLKIQINDKDFVNEKIIELIKRFHLPTENESNYFIDKTNVLQTANKNDQLIFNIQKVIDIHKHSNFLNEAKITLNNIGNLQINELIFDSDYQHFESFAKKIRANIKITAIQNESFSLEHKSDNIHFLKYKSKYGYTILEFNRLTNKIHSINHSLTPNWTEQYYFTRNILNNVNWTLNETKEAKPKLKKKNLFIAFFGLSIFITLATFTFLNIFSGEDIIKSMEIVSEAFLVSPWPYLLLMNAILTAFLWVIFGYFFSRWEKIDYNFRNGLKFVLSGYFKNFIGVITGSHIVAMASWVWFMRLGKESNQRSATLMGQVSVFSVFNALLNLMLGTMFLSVNSWYAYTLQWDPTIWYGASWFVGLSWAGLFAQTFVILSSSAIFLLPGINKWIFKLWGVLYLFKKHDNYFDKVLSMNVRREQLSSQRSNIFDAKRMKRSTSVIMAAHVLTFFELSYMLEIASLGSTIDPMGITIEYSQYLTDSLIWGQIFQLNSMRISISMMNKLNPLPGEMYTTEWTQVEALEALFRTNGIPTELVTPIATQTGFISRFFAFYLPTMVSGVIACTALVFKFRQIRKDSVGAKKL